MRRFVATMEARSAAAEPFPASTSNGKAGQQGVTYHSSGMQSYSSQLRRAAGPGDSIILPSDLETTTRPPEMGPNEGDNGYATKRRDTNHRTSETGIEAPSAGSALEALPAARVAGMAKPSKISALCPGCNEEAFGLMVVQMLLKMHFHS
jgi:cystathionine beta-lyase/cystathionine gamma-synthase